ncbi:MAG TPA: ATP-binding protein [Patescibacteria group bacterium]|nr:ATP-binding protein [Patescibacteria group bacterium]
MFSKLRLKLTLANVIVAILIFIVVFTGVYITMYKSIINQSYQLMNVLTYSVISGGDTQNPKMLGLFGNQAFIIADISQSGQVTGYKSTPFMPVPTKEYVDEIAAKAITQNDKINNLFYSYRDDDSPEKKSTIILMSPNTTQSSNGGIYLTELLKKEDNSFAIIFVNMDYESSLLKSLRFNLIMVALIGLALVCLGSLFMAGKAVKPIKAAWEKQKNFVADASHELRTPLSVIQTNLELVMENKTDTVESQMNWLENIYLENKHMTKLVSDLLLLARADSDQKLLEMKNFCLSKAVQDAATPFVPMAKETNVKIDFFINPDVNYFGDESRINQLIVILLDNAVKYTPSGGRITLELKNNKDSIEMNVSDTGEGIDKEDYERIFERFYRVDKARSSENGGVGLGLSIANWIVKEHQGTINVFSTLGEGTTFKITFPKNIKQKQTKN